MTNTINMDSLANITDAEMDALVAIRSSDSGFDWEKVSLKSLYRLQAATGIDFSLWINDRLRQGTSAMRRIARDYEREILIEQEKIDNY